MTKTVCVLILAVAVMYTPPIAAQQNRDPNQLAIAFSDPNRPATVEVDVFGGGITVRAYAGREVIITARDSRDNDVFGQAPQSQGLRRLTAGRLSVNEANNVVSIRGSRFDSPDLEIQVPARTNLKLRTMNEGIEVEGIDGDIEATSLNDEVTLINVAGSVVADSRNDDVKVTMSRLSPDKPMAFSSVNGDVDVTLPANVKASVRMSTVNGDIYTDFDMQVSGGTGAGLQRPGRNRVMTGTINGGGPNFQLSSVNGNIYIRKGR